MALGGSWLSKRERVIALEPCDSGLLGTTLRYPYEVRDAADYFAELPEVAVEAGDFNPATFHDRYEPQGQSRPSPFPSKAKRRPSTPDDQSHGRAAPKHSGGQQAVGSGPQRRPHGHAA